MTDTRLLDAVDALTKPTVENVKQTTDDGEYLRTVPVEHPALLQQLADAVVPSAGNDGGSKSASARERNVLDSDALWELTKIQTELRDWMRHERHLFDRADLPATLRRWYVGYIRQVTAAELDEWHVRELRRWERVITAKLDRSIKQWDTGKLCPICKQARWTDQHGDSQPARLVGSYRCDEDGRTSEERIVCQRCRESWDNRDAIKELGEELVEISSARAATQVT
ncbi:hypothetical protein QP735_04265 [Curtobacterium citreum]|uniref:DUF7341 domain-containing protein n=1 Tax=Curtobacterium citreum TaxID=2036 RepID=UPI002551020D|nr:hypothetical protein [Curtobacterium citreum]MDK8171738.1 hypothetical protein [Curtobacterium citreum]